MNYELYQADVKTRLAANADLAGIPLVMEADPTATPAEHAAIEKTWEDALATKGLVLCVMSPLADKTDESRGGALALRVTVPVCLTENITVNRGKNEDGDAGLGLNPQAVIRVVISTLLAARYDFPAAPIGRPSLGEGLAVYYVQPSAVNIIRTGETLSA